jgi:putative hydrolase of the HAD superfamily
MKYKHLFFDIDRTMWDYDTNSREVIHELHQQFKFDSCGFDATTFFDTFNHYNQLMWAKFREGLIRKDTLRSERFRLSLRKLGITENLKELTYQLSAAYFAITPHKTKLFPNVIETLDYLKPKYNLHIITNGFDEVQFKKLSNCGLDGYWQRIVTSDASGYQKPNKQIFRFALSGANARKEQSLMIGDDWEVDIIGARNFGIDQVFFNPHGEKREGNATFEIAEFSQLRDIL